MSTTTTTMAAKFKDELGRVAHSIEHHFGDVGEYAYHGLANVVNSALHDYTANVRKYVIKPVVSDVERVEKIMEYHAKKEFKEVDELLQDLAKDGRDSKVAGIISHLMAGEHPDITVDAEFVSKYPDVHKPYYVEFDHLARILKWYAGVGCLPMVRFCLFAMKMGYPWPRNVDSGLPDRIKDMLKDSDGYTHLMPHHFNDLQGGNDGAEHALIFVLLATGYDPLDRLTRRGAAITQSSLKAHLAYHVKEGKDRAPGETEAEKYWSTAPFAVHSYMYEMRNNESYITPRLKDHKHWKRDVPEAHLRLGGIYPALGQFLVFAHQFHTTSSHYMHIGTNSMINKPDTHLPRFMLDYLKTLIAETDEPAKKEHYVVMQVHTATAFITVAAQRAAASNDEHSAYYAQIVTLMKFVIKNKVLETVDTEIMMAIVKNVAVQYPNNLVKVYTYLRGLQEAAPYKGFAYSPRLKENMNPKIYKQIAALDKP